MFLFRRRSSDDTEIITIPELSGASGQARVTFINAPFQCSRSKNRMKFVDGDFGHTLINEIYANQSRFTVLKGWPQPSHFCRRCDALLDVSHAQPQAYELDITLKRFEPFRLRIEVPAVICASCGAFNALDGEEITNDINEAMLSAFVSHNIKP